MADRKAMNDSANDSPADRIDVLIVGGGPTGLALACLCRRMGVELKIIDKKSGPSTTSKAIGLQYRVSEILAWMGVVDRFLEIGESPTPVNIYEGSRRLVRFEFDLGNIQTGQNAFVPCPIMLQQSETERLLVELLLSRGAEVEWGAELLDFEQNDNEVVSRIRFPDGHEQHIRSSWLVSCEGAHSVARKAAGISFEGKTYPQSFAIADVRIKWPIARQENHVWMHPSGSFAALPLPGGSDIWRLFFEMKSGEDAAQEVTLPLIRTLMAERSGFTGGEISEPIWLSSFRINCRMVNRFRSGRVFVAGDAAHIHSPTGGQGITTGVQDAANLAWKLARVINGAPESLLDTYQEERLPKAREVLGETDRTTRVLFSPNPIGRLIRDYLILPVLRMKLVQRRMFGKLSQLHVSYRGSSLSVGVNSSGLRAGDRAPDVAFKAVKSGSIVTLFRLLQPGRPVLLISARGSINSATLRGLVRGLMKLDLDAFVMVSNTDDPVQGGSTLDARSQETGSGSNDLNLLQDLHGDLQRIYGLTEDFLCLIRPDGHIGLVQSPISLAVLTTYLLKICRSEGAEEIAALVKEPKGKAAGLKQ